MNWEMAKNWLIISFLVLDVVLGWQVYQSRRELLSYVESYSDQLANTKTLLAGHGFSLDTTVPSAHPDMAFVHAEFATPNLQSIMKQAFPTDQTYTVDDGTGTGDSADGSVKLGNKGTWRVQYVNTPKIDNNPAAVLKYALNGNSYSFTGANIDDGKPNSQKTWTYELQFQSMPLFDALINASVKNGQLQEFTQDYLVNLSTSGDKKPTITALDALNNLANTVDKSMQRTDNKILDIRLGYYHKLGSDASRDSIIVPSSTYWSPVWQVISTDQVYYINAFTGEVDTPS